MLVWVGLTLTSNGLAFEVKSLKHFGAYQEYFFECVYITFLYCCMVILKNKVLDALKVLQVSVLFQAHGFQEELRLSKSNLML